MMIRAFQFRELQHFITHAVLSQDNNKKIYIMQVLNIFFYIVVTLTLLARGLTLDVRI